MMAFLLGCLCGFVGTMLIVFLMLSFIVGGDKKDE